MQALKKTMNHAMSTGLKRLRYLEAIKDQVSSAANQFYSPAF